MEKVPRVAGVVMQDHPSYDTAYIGPS